MKVFEIMQRRVTTVEETDTLGLALQLMLWREIRHLPVLRGRQLVGILSQRDVLAMQVQQDDALAHPVRDAMHPPEQIRPGAEVADAAADMAAKKRGCLPVVADGELVGLITRSDVLSVLAQYPVPEAPLSTPTAESLVVRKPVTVHQDDYLLDAAGRMVSNSVRHLCVVDVDERLVGMLSDRDVRAAVGNPLQAAQQAAPRRGLAELRVAHAMTSHPRSVRVGTSLADLIQALLVEGVGALPVLGNTDTLVGVVSYMDVLRAVAAGTAR